MSLSVRFLSPSELFHADVPKLDRTQPPLEQNGPGIRIVLVQPATSSSRHGNPVVDLYSIQNDSDFTPDDRCLQILPLPARLGGKSVGCLEVPDRAVASGSKLPGQVIAGE